MIIVGFQAQVRHGYLFWLKRGFRHCFAYQRTDSGWVLCDPLGAGLLLEAAPAIPVRALLCALAAVEASIVAVDSRGDARRLPWLRPLTCVEICKRLAGRSGMWLLTPYQLFRDLVSSEATSRFALDGRRN